MTERCPYCSFDPTSMNDYCDKHRPNVMPAPAAPGDGQGTPRTDNAVFLPVTGTHGHEWVYASFARQLEREVAALTVAWEDEHRECLRLQSARAAAYEESARLVALDFGDDVPVVEQLRALASNSQQEGK